MPQIARVGDKSDHVYDGENGVIISGAPNTNADGLPIARVGDQHSCPIPGHGVTPIVSSPVTKSNSDGMLIAVVGAQAECGAVIITGSPNSTAS